MAEFFPRNVLSPGGSLLADSQRGPIVFTYVLFGVGRGTGGSKTYRVYRVFFLRKCFIVTGGRVDGLDGHGKCPLIFSILRYINFGLVNVLWGKKVIQVV